jgi:hypothetical protein
MEDVWEDLPNELYDEEEEMEKKSSERLPKTIRTKTGTRPIGNLPPSALEEVWFYVLNPDAQELTVQETETIKVKSNAFTKAQALQYLEPPAGDGVGVGFLDNGQPYDFIKGLLIDLRDGRRYNDQSLGHSGKTEEGARRLVSFDTASKADNLTAKEWKLKKQANLHVHGLWEHEILVDSKVGKLPVEYAYNGRNFLKK